QRVTHVLRERFDRRERPRFSRLFAQPQRVANPPPRGRPRLVAAQAIRVAEGVRLQLLVKAQLVVQIPIELIPLEEKQQTSEHRTHGTLLSVRTLRLYPRCCAPRTPRHARLRAERSGEASPELWRRRALSLARGSLRSRGSLAAARSRCPTKERRGL